jgi:hypothetical protein
LISHPLFQDVSFVPDDLKHVVLKQSTSGQQCNPIVQPIQDEEVTFLELQSIINHKAKENGAKSMILAPE